jgi:flagellar protein FlaG
MRIDEVAQHRLSRVAPSPDTAAISQGATGHREVVHEHGPMPASREGEVGERRERDPEALERVVKSINERLFRVGQRLELYLVEGTDEVAARIVDERTKKVVLEIPPHEIIELRERLDEMVGLLFDKGA